VANRLSMFKAKVHRATVTHGDVDYEGSVTISGELMDAAGILEYEQVHVWNLARGTRLVSYAIRGDDHSGVICMNGAAAHLACPGEKIIIATFAEVDEREAPTWKPTVVLVDDANRAIAGDHQELAGPKRRPDAHH
jgi:aspartate 1-decarboxylase